MKPATGRQNEPVKEWVTIKTKHLAMISVW